MCFLIDPFAKPWTNRFVYKVVTPTRRSLQTGATQYKVGKVIKALPKSSQFLSDYRGITKQGFYVCKTKKAARDYVRNNWYGVPKPPHIIIKLAVDPKDFLYAAFAGVNDGDYINSATYRKVTVVA